MNLPVNYNDISQHKRKKVREEYVRLQKGLCYHCGKTLDGPPCSSVTKMKVDKKLFPIYFFKYPVHLHHDHITGMTIGAVHSQCNAVLWQYFGE